ncbi:MAG: lamin tail domain-containing protein, partial [Chloroflexota bacterium]
NVAQPGWSGPAVYPYTVGSVFAAEGQILYRRPGESSDIRVPDTDTAQDWAQYGLDVIGGRRVRYPGWDLERFYAGHWLTETAEFVVGIAPDNAYELIRGQISGASSEVQIATLTFRSGAIAEELVAALDRGVEVTVMLEGGPVGGIDDAERHVCQKLEDAGGQCWFMVNETDVDSDDGSPIHDRYRYMHAKYVIIDGRRAIISTENLSPDSLPNDDKNDGTWGRRGVILVTDAPAAVGRLRAIWEADFDPINHRDLVRWDAGDANYGAPRPGSTPITFTGGISYPVRFHEPTVLSGTFSYGIVQAPENSLADPAGLLHLLAQADQGDTILIEQLREKPHWGASDSNSIDDPNPRLEALIEAARRGATVHLLLDDFFDDGRKPDSNWATCSKVEQAASAEGLNLRCALANRTGLGLHNKMVLAQIDGKGYVFIGSINGTELSHKGNREVALLLQSDEAYELLADVFFHDWPYVVNMPIVSKEFWGPADHLLISEVFYDPPGADDAEFIELHNPTPRMISLSGYSLGDALKKSDFEDVRRFPDGAVIGSDSTIVVALAATSFRSQFGFDPDFEILSTSPAVPNLPDDPNWGDPAAVLQLGNAGDEVIVRDHSGQIIEAIAYGAGMVPDNISCTLATLHGASLERYPPWRDTDDCSRDFRVWPLPNPGVVP